METGVLSDGYGFGSVHRDSSKSLKENLFIEVNLNSMQQGSIPFNRFTNQVKGE